MLRTCVLLLLAVSAYGQPTFQSIAPLYAVNGVAVDQDGEIWAATQGGVMKFSSDGTLLNTYTNVDGLMHNQVTSVFIDSRGDKWFGTYEGGISRLHGDTWESFGILLRFGYEVSSIVEDAQGNMWFASNYYLFGAAKFDGTNWSLVNDSNSGLASNSVNALAVEGENVWFGLSNAVSGFDGTSWVSYTLPNAVTSIAVDSHGDKWLMQFDRVSRLSGTTVTSFLRADLGLASNESPTSIFIDNDDNLWIGAALSNHTGTGIVRYSIDTQQATRFTEPTDEVQQIIEVNDELYVASGYWTKSGRLYRFDGTTWFEYSNDNTLKGYTTTSILEDADGNHWFGTRNAGVTKFDGATYTAYNSSNSGLASNDVFSLAQTPNGDIFAGTASGVMVFQDGVWSSSYSTSRVNRMATESNGNLWIVSEYNGAAMYDGTTWTTYNVSTSAIVSNQCWGLDIDADDNIWIGTYDNKGISRFSNGVFTSFTKDNSGLAEGIVIDILADADNTIWASVYEVGIYKYTLGQWTLAYNTDNSPLPTNGIQSMHQDAAGNYWFGSDYGTTPGLAVFNGNTWKIYRDELVAKQVSYVGEDHDGNIWVGTQWGASRISGDPFAKLSQTIQFDELPEKTYGDVPFVLSATADSDLIVTFTSSDETVASITGTTVTILKAGSTTIEATQGGNDEYLAAAQVERILTVSKAPQTITFGTLPAKKFKDAPFDLEVHSDSDLPVAFSSSDLTVATIAGKTLTIVGTGSTTITANQPGNNNYLPAIGVERELEVSKAPQGITFNVLPAKALGDAAFNLLATSDSQLPVVYSSSNTAVATISGSIVTIVGAGTTTITASQPGDDHFETAPEKQQDLVVSKHAQAINFGALTTRIFGDLPFDLTASSDSQLALTYSSSNPLVVTITNSTATIVGAGSVTITANQPGNDQFEAAEPISQALVISKAAQSITFTQPQDKTLGNPSFDLTATTSSSLMVSFSSGSDKISIADNEVSLLKAGRVIITASQGGNSNYDAAVSVDQSFCVNPAMPVITPTGDNASLLTLSSSASSGNQWFRDGIELPGETSAALIVSVAGVYKVKAKAEDCESEFSEELPVVITAVSENPPSALTVYPNPADDFIEIRGAGEKINSIVLIDATGRLLTLSVQAIGDHYIGDVGHLPSGIYLLRIYQSGSVKVVRLAKR